MRWLALFALLVASYTGAAEPVTKSIAMPGQSFGRSSTGLPAGAFIAL